MDALGPTLLPDAETRPGELLRALLAEYIRAGEPVSSRALARTSREQLSSASVRTVLADLEEQGLIAHPHTSAGSVPTDEALRRFAREALAATRPDDDLLRALTGRLGEGGGESDALARAAAGELARLSRQLSFILLPPLTRLRIRHLDFVQYDGRRVLAILAGDDGQVRHRMVETDALLTAVELQSLGNYLRAHCLGMTLAEARQFLADARELERARHDALSRAAGALGAAAFAPEPGADLGTTLHVAGAAQLLARAAGESDAPALARLARAIEDKEKWIALLARLSEGEGGGAPGPRVLVGDEMGDGELSGLSVLTAPYFRGDEPLGALALVGPKRMEYDRLCAQIRTLAAALTAILSERR